MPYDPTWEHLYSGPKARYDDRGSKGGRLTRSRDRLLIGVAVCIAAISYVIPFVDRGWIPHDEGLIAQSAERLLGGELPHRDFDEVYTGGLTALHGMAFRLLGLRILSLRICLLVFSMAFAAALYAVACRFARPVTAGLVTLLGWVWSLPNHFSSMPSWYNLFLATFGALALLGYLETEHRVWIFAAGALAGLAMLIKLHGVFVVAAGLLFLVYREEVTAPRGGGTHASKSFLLLKGVGLSCFVILLWRLVSNRPGEMEMIHFFLPGTAICAFLLWSESRAKGGSFPARVRGLLDLLFPFLAGVVAPVVVFLIPYVAAGEVKVLMRGVFGSAGNRVSIPSLGVWLPPLPAFSSGLVYGMVLFIPGSVWRRGKWRNVAAACAVLLCAVVFFFSTRSVIYREVFYSARSLGVLAVLSGCVLLIRGTRSGAITADRRQKVFLLISVTGMVSLVQFPFAAPVYFCYAAPLVAVAVLAVVEGQPPKLLHLSVLLFYLSFAILRTNVGYVYNLGNHFERYQAKSQLRLERAGIRVPEADRVVYESLVALIQEKSRPGPIFAGPDCPEVYFLSERSNPTRTLTEIQRPSKWRPEALVRFLRDRSIEVVVINTRPEFSLRLPSFGLASLGVAYPNSRRVGRFMVLWK